MITECLFAVLNDPPCIVTKDGRIYAVDHRNNHQSKMKKRAYVNTSSGYVQVKINNKAYSVHRLVARAFYGECPEGKEVDHIDRNKKNNAINNLRYVTREENMFNRSNSITSPGTYSCNKKDAVRLYNQRYRVKLREKGFYYGTEIINGKSISVKKSVNTNQKGFKNYEWLDRLAK